jgi:hypothetical protein
MRVDAFLAKSGMKRVYTHQMFHFRRVQTRRSAFGVYMGDHLGEVSLKDKDFSKFTYILVSSRNKLRFI